MLFLERLNGLCLRSGLYPTTRIPQMVDLQTPCPPAANLFQNDVIHKLSAIFTKGQ